MVLKAVLNRILPGDPADHRYLSLQPALTLGETLAGWKGVRRWCREVQQRPGSSLGFLLSGKAGPALDLLVIIPGLFGC
jgi:hypothetical protein